jgi:hypothetical protein
MQGSLEYLCFSETHIGFDGSLAGLPSAIYLPEFL